MKRSPELILDAGKYGGEWVVIVGNQVIAHDKDPRKLKPVMESCKATPTLAWVPGTASYIF